VYKAAVRWMIRRNVRALASGDPRPLLAGYADSAVLVFPGRSSRSGEYRGKAAIEGFLRRYLQDGVVGQAHEILVNGPPWRTVVCVRFNTQAKAPSGETVYDNRAVLFARARWGKIVYQEDFEDTHKIDDFEAYLNEPAGQPAGSAGSATG
jgi:ketosteroid isomerase-like protein